MSIRYPQRWQHCTVCHAPTQFAVVGNRLLSRWDVHRLPDEGVPAISWRCEKHRTYKMRPASAIQANEYGDLCYTLTCGHQSQWVFRHAWKYTQDMIERGLVTGELRLEERHRCFACADLAREGGGNA